MYSVFIPRELVRWWSAVASCASRDASRPVLTGVLVGVGWQSHPLLGEFVGVTLTATDSYRLLSVGIPATVQSAEDFAAEFVGESRPMGARVVPEDGASHWVNVPAAAVKVGVSDGLRMSWYSSDLHEHVGGNYGVGVDVDVVTAKGRSIVESIPGGVDSFPNWANLFPGGESIGRLDPFAVNGAYLGGMLSDMAKAGGLTSPARIISAEDGRKPVRVDCVGEGFAAAGIVMPVRVPDDRGVLGHLPGDPRAEVVGS